MLFPFRGGKISIENRVFDAAFKCSVTFIGVNLSKNTAVFKGSLEQVRGMSNKKGCFFKEAALEKDKYLFCYYF